MSDTQAKRPILVVAAGQTFAELSRAEGDFPDWIARGLGEGLPLRQADARTAEAYPDPRELAGVVVSGSHAMVTERAPWSERLALWLKRCVDAELPVLGICFGHQLLAHALGGQVDRLAEGPEVGTREIRLTPEARDDAVLGALPARFPAQLIHYQSVLRLPPGAVRLALSDIEAHQAFRVGKRAWGVQFHPEFSATAMRGYLERLKGELGDEAIRRIDEVRPTPQAAEVLRRFAAVARASSF